jgi:NAD(P)-dependent dehydrogenase (short-subunit alcohol dehydrogenase family)
MNAVPHAALTCASLFSVAGRTALISGGGRGIGEMIARTLTSNGARVFITSRSAETLRRTAAALTAAGPGTCTALPAADLSTEAGCRAAAASLAGHVDRLDILVNNSGISWGAPFSDFPEAAWDRVLALNVKAPFLLLRACRPLLEAGRGGGGGSGPARVVNVGSIVGLRPQDVPTYSYDASKAALHALTTKLAGELAPNITVNAIAPGYVPTRMSRGLLTFAAEDALRRAIPMQRFGSAADMGGAALFLCSDAGAWVTGTVVTVDGGSTARPMALAAPPEDAA